MQIAHNFVKLDATGQPLPADAAHWTAVLDRATDLIWSADNITKKPQTWAKAKAAAEAFQLCGQSARLPTVEELFALADRSRFDPAIDTDFFPETKGWYWSSSLDASAPADCAWYVGFSYGLASLYYQHYQGCVRAVRSASPAASQ